MNGQCYLSLCRAKALLGWVLSPGHSQGRSGSGATIQDPGQSPAGQDPGQGAPPAASVGAGCGSLPPAEPSRRGWPGPGVGVFWGCILCIDCKRPPSSSCSSVSPVSPQGAPAWYEKTPPALTWGGQIRKVNSTESACVGPRGSPQHRAVGVQVQLVARMGACAGLGSAGLPPTPQ